MKTITILLLACTMMLVSSCEIIDTILNPKPGDCVLLNMSFTIPNDPAHVETEFKYDASNNLIEVIKEEYDYDPEPGTKRWTISYSNDFVDEIKTFYKFYDTQEVANYEYQFFYNGNLLDSVKLLSPSSSIPAGHMIPHYTGDKLSKLIEYVWDQNTSAWYAYYTQDLEWTGDNISKITATYSNGSQRVSEFEYDDKKTSLCHLGYAISSAGSLTILSKNNVIKSTLTAWVGTDVFVSENTFTYNSSDYPIKSVALEGYIITYEYDCK